MSDQITIARDIIELSHTIQAGLEHLKNRMAEGHLQDTEYLFADILAALGSVFQAFEPFIAEPDRELMDKLKDKLLMALEGLCANYEHSLLDMAKKNLEFVLMPAFQVWKSEMQKCLGPWLES